MPAGCAPDTRASAPCLSRASSTSAEQLEYYLIRVLDERDHTRIHSEFNRSLADWTEEFTSWFDRRVLGIERVL